MGPKKKDKGKGKGKGKGGSGRAQAVIDGVPISNMSKEQLEGHVVRLRNELEREREERNFVQNELERVQRLWQVAAENLDNIRGELRHKDAEIADAEEKHQQEIKVMQQKMKELMSTQENKIADLQISSENALLNLHSESLKEEAVLAAEREDLRNQLSNLENKYLTVIANMKVTHSCDLEGLREQFETESGEMETKYVKRIKSLQSQLDLKRKTELVVQEERKNNFLASVIENHEKTYEELKKYYTDVTSANLKVISELKSDLEAQKAREQQVTREMSSALHAREKLEAEVNQLKKQLTDTQKSLSKSQNLTQNLRTCEAKVKMLKSEKESLEWELEVLHQKAEKIEGERSELYDHFVAVVSEVQQRSQMRNIVLEKRLTELSEQLEKKEAVLSEVLTATNMDPASLTQITRQLEAIIDEKNNLVSNLREEVATMRKMYTDILDKKPDTSKSKSGKSSHL